VSHTAQEALGGLRGVASVASLAERAPVPASRIGFSRILFSRIRDGTWFPCSASAGEDEEFAQKLDDQTSREADVLRALPAGKTDAQIALSLFVAEGTVKSHVRHILRKLGAANRTDAVAKYHRQRN
jgi:DNA-binding NarL/FixJ family response regulator